MTDILDDKVELKVGHIVNGVVKFVCSEFAIVTVDNFDFILPAQEYSWNLRDKLDSNLHEGDKVTCVVVKIENTQVMVSIKRCSTDPWADIDKRYSVGQCLKLEVGNVTDYGAFMELEPGITGLLHISEACLHGRFPIRWILDICDVLNVWIKEIDVENHKISLTLKPYLENCWKKFISLYNETDNVNATITYFTDDVLFTRAEGVLMQIRRDQTKLSEDEDWDDFFEIGQRVTLQIDKIKYNKFTVKSHIVTSYK